MEGITDNLKYKLLLDKSIGEIENIAIKINEYRELNSNDFTNEEWSKRVHEVAGSLHDFFKIFTEFGKFKDRFIDASYFINYEGLQARLTSEKTKQTFEFGFDFKGVYLQLYISHPEYLKNMHDDFWQQFLSLSNWGEFNFEENAGFSTDIKRKYSHLFKPTKGNIYRLMRNYFLQELLYVDSYNESLSDLGWLTIRWSPEKYSTEEMLILGCESFKILYGLNYSLWKVGSLNEYYGKKKGVKD